jgi:cytochrome c
MMRALAPVPALFAALIAFSLALAPPAPAQELRGHGGPVRAIAVSPDGQGAMTGSFDQSAILWRLDQGVASAVLRFHEGAVNAVAALPDGRFATGGEDGRIAIWNAAGLATGAAPERVIEGHKGGVVALALSPDGRRLASASWDGTARVTQLADGAASVLEGHKGPLAGAAFAPDGGLVTTGHDATLRFWPADGTTPLIRQLDAPLAGVAVAPDGEIVAAGADGRLRLFGPDLSERASLEIAPVPLVALALSPDAGTIAAGGLRGQTPLVDRASRSIRAVLVGPGLPVWSLAFSPDGKELYSGGADRLVRRWNAVTGEHMGAVSPRAGENVMAGLSEERGAQVFRACAACHTLTPQDGNRAGPTLHGVFGRRIGTAAGYNFSPALTQMDIVWNAETISRLFEIGPNAYTPGTKMPEQVITSAADRKALVEWLEKVTR